MIKPTILVVDDRADVRLSARFVLEDNHYQVLEAESLQQAKEQVMAHAVSLILLDMNYSRDTTSGEEGLSLLRWLQKSEYSIPAIAMTAWSNVELAVSAMQLGANDFLEKPWKNQRLLQVISQQLDLQQLKKQNQKLHQQLQQNLEDDNNLQFNWQSPCMVELLQQIDSVAQTDVAVLLTGENGTGKSYLAKRIHQGSLVNQGPFVSVNMAAIADNLFESEMFGHKKGAFTDAKTNRIGRFELAQHGTLFLDEIATIPQSQQAKLLRVLESGEYEVLGSSQTETTDVRIISASNGNFAELIAAESFREDLFYRLNTIEFRVPSLKERHLDIVPLAEYFVTGFSEKYAKPHKTLTDGAKQALLDYHWPGNIRELSHLMERAVLLSRADSIELKDLNIQHCAAPQSLPLMTLQSAEVNLIKQAMGKTNNNVAAAAKILGLTKSSMYRRLEKYPEFSY